MEHLTFGEEFLGESEAPVSGGRYSKDWYYTLDHLQVFGLR